MTIPITVSCQHQGSQKENGQWILPLIQKYSREVFNDYLIILAFPNKVTGFVTDKFEGQMDTSKTRDNLTIENS